MPSAYAPAVGGVEILTQRLAVQLRASGDEVEVWTNRYPSELPADEELEAVRVRRFPMPLPPAQVSQVMAAPAGAMKAVATLAGAVRQFRPDLIHVQCFGNNGVYATWASLTSRRPLVVTLQGETVMDDHDIYDRSLLLRSGLRLALRRAGAVTACSQFVLDDAVDRFGLAPGAGRVIFNGVDIDGAAASEPVALPFDRYVLGLGRVVAKKGFDLLIGAWAPIAGSHPGVGVTIAGGGAERDRLEAEAQRRGVADSVHFTGPVSQGQVRWLMANAELFVLPSRVEPFGIVVLEALRAGIPVVVSSRGAAAEIVTSGREGLVVDPFDPVALGGAISALLDDDERRGAMGHLGALRAGDFSWSRIAAEYRSLYHSVCASAVPA
ncbi:MAG TPA: glycosyltransferase family 4 protein [Acidimicrobiales bacterium]|nr:glycosyltransferase family 4 protein [Acidimicrobiales bacterium]